MVRAQCKVYENGVRKDFSIEADKTPEKILELLYIEEIRFIKSLYGEGEIKHAEGKFTFVHTNEKEQKIKSKAKVCLFDSEDPKYVYFYWKIEFQPVN